MDFLNWVFKTTVLMAMLFLGMESRPEKEEANDQANNATSIHFMLR